VPRIPIRSRLPPRPRAGGFPHARRDGLGQSAATARPRARESRRLDAVRVGPRSVGPRSIGAARHGSSSRPRRLDLPSPALSSHTGRAGGGAQLLRHAHAAHRPVAMWGVGKAAEEAREAAVGGPVHGEARDASAPVDTELSFGPIKAGPRRLEQENTTHRRTASEVAHVIIQKHATRQTSARGELRGSLRGIP
jgi:hypothetical protein